PQTVTVFDARLPPHQRPRPGTHEVFDTHVFPQDFSAPTIVVARHPQDIDSEVLELRQRRERAEASTRDDGLPLEPEIEEIAVDDQRAGIPGESAQEGNEG